jgi:hypothetical protein
VASAERIGEAMPRKSMPSVTLAASVRMARPSPYFCVAGSCVTKPGSLGDLGERLPWIAGEGLENGQGTRHRTDIGGARHRTRHRRLGCVPAAHRGPRLFVS